jgi:hypothetical protein
VPPAAVGGATSARLVADVALRADGTLWVDAWLRNDIAMQDGGGPVQYAMRVLLDGREALATGQLRQLQYTGFGRLFGSLRGTAAAMPPHVRHDITYLAETGAIARYDQSVGVEEAVLDRMTRLMNEPDWQVPFGPRGITRSMGMAGNRPDIGPMTLWQAAWIVAGDRQAAAFVVGQAEAEGAIPWHFWDPRGGADGSGGWMDVKRWPRFWVDPRGGQPPHTLLQPMPAMAISGWGPNRSHQPDLSYIPYLLTGRRALLDGLLSQATWGFLSQWPAPRGYSAGYPPIADLNLVHESQPRSVAWCLRTLGNAAWVAPDGDPNVPFLRTALQANWGWLRMQIPRWTAEQGEAHGWIDTTNLIGRNGQASPWQQDFIASAATMAAKRGNDDARAFLQWMTNFVVGRFLAEARGFNPRDGVAYAIAFAPSGDRPVRLHRTWAEIGADTLARGYSNEAGWKKSEGYYGRLSLYSLAGIADALDSEPARRAHRWLLEAGPPFTRAWVYARDPTLAVMPRGQPREPARMPGCTQAART